MSVASRKRVQRQCLDMIFPELEKSLLPQESIDIKMQFLQILCFQNKCHQHCKSDLKFKNKVPIRPSSIGSFLL